jgi:AAHS family 4-hydroxybenzoate transporter-like MFS transporter
LTDRERSAIDVAPLLDEGRWTRYQQWLVFLTALTIVFDGMDNQLLGIVIPTMVREWGVGRQAFAPVVTYGYVGMMLGGALAGLAGDRVGRRTALLGSMMIFGVMTAAASLANGTLTFGAIRFLAGIGLGGAIPNAAALAVEYVPRAARPVAATLTIVCVPLGGMFAGILGMRVLPAVGWQALFIAGGVIPIVGVLVLRKLLPESPRFLARHPERFGELARDLRRMGHSVPSGATFVDRSEGSGRQASVAALFQPEFRRNTIALWISFVSCLLTIYIVFNWLTSVLTAAGYDPATANTGITSFNLGGVAGALIGGAAISRYGSRLPMLAMTAAAIGCAVVLSRMAIGPSHGMLPIFLMIVLTGALINGVQVMMYALAAHVYPSAVRATGVGSASSFGRIGAILSGYVGSWAIDAGGTTQFFTTIAASLVVTLISLAAVARHIAPRGQR